MGNLFDPSPSEMLFQGLEVATMLELWTPVVSIVGICQPTLPMQHLFRLQNVQMEILVQGAVANVRGPSLFLVLTVLLK